MLRVEFPPALQLQCSQRQREVGQVAARRAQRREIGAALPTCEVVRLGIRPRQALGVLEARRELVGAAGRRCGVLAQQEATAPNGGRQRVRLCGGGRGPQCDVVEARVQAKMVCHLQTGQQGGRGHTHC